MRSRTFQFVAVFAYLALLVLGVCPARSQSGVGTEAPVPLLTLDAAIAAALRNNSDDQLRALDARKAEEAIREAKTSRYPQLSVKANAGYLLTPLTFTVPKGALGTYPATGPIPHQDASITTPRSLTALIYTTAAQPLTQCVRINLAVRDASLGSLLANEAERAQRISTVSQVKAAYFGLITSQSQIEGSESSLRYLERLDKEVESNLAQQNALEADSLSIKAKLAQQHYRLLTLRDSLQTQKELLNRLLGEDLSTDFRVEMQSAPAPEELDLTTAKRTALEQRPEIKQAELQAKRADLAIRRERANYIPNVSAQFSYLSAPNITFLPQNAASIGLLFEWQPFDWGEKRSHTQQLKLASQQARVSQGDARQQVLLEVGSTFRKLTEARALLDTQAAVTAAEEEKLRELLNRYEQKAALLSDVLEQQSTVAQAHADKAQDVASFWTSKADFERALGGQ